MASVMELLESSEFKALVWRARQRPLLRREFDADARIYVPEGRDPDEVWRALASLRRSLAFHNPFFGYDEHGIKQEWYTIPDSFRLSVERMGDLARQGSPLDVAARERGGARFVSKEYIDEILANLAYDGFPSDYESVRAVLLRERPPLGVAERLADNFHRVMCGLDDAPPQAITPSTIREVYARLCTGIPADAPRDLPETYPVANYLATAGASIPPLDTLLAAECALTDGTLTEPVQHPIVRSLLVQCFFWRYSSFPRFNNFMGCAVSRIFLYLHGYPVFRYLPKASIYRKWKAGEVDGVPYPFEDAVVVQGNAADYTPLYDVIMRLMLDAVVAMQATLDGRRRADDALFGAIERAPYLNYR